MIRIYQQFSKEQFMSADCCRYFLAYLKIRQDSIKRGSYFHLHHFLKAVDLKDRAGKAFIKVLVAKGFVVDLGKNRYRIVAQVKAFVSNRRNLFYSITEKQLNGFSLRKIASFRALIVELENERYKRHQRATIKGYTVTNKRTGKKETIKKIQLREWIQFMAGDCTVALIGKSISTVNNYRRLQKVCGYCAKPYFVKAGKPEGASLGKEIKPKDYPGKIFFRADGFIVSPPSTRIRKQGFILKRS